MALAAEMVVAVLSESCWCCQLVGYGRRYTCSQIAAVASLLDQSHEEVVDYPLAASQLVPVAHLHNHLPEVYTANVVCKTDHPEEIHRYRSLDVPQASEPRPIHRAGYLAHNRCREISIAHDLRVGHRASLSEVRNGLGRAGVDESARRALVSIDSAGIGDRTRPTQHPIGSANRPAAQQPAVHDHVERGCTEDAKAPSHTVDETAMALE
jgi:hypothetical protein